MNYFELPEKRVQLSMRVPESVKDRLLATAKLWAMIAEARGERSDGIDITHVCVRLLAVGLDGVWAEVGAMAELSGMPRNDAEWQLLQKALSRRFADERASKGRK